MATQNQKGVAVDESDAGLMELLEQTIHGRVLKELEEQLPNILHSAVRGAIVTASKEVPPRKGARRMASSTPPKTKTGSRPASGGRCAEVWDEMDKLVGKGKTPTLQDVTKLAERKNWNSNTARIQFYRWRSAQPSE
jgi:hypothetical protein